MAKIISNPENLKMQPVLAYFEAKGHKAIPQMNFFTADALLTLNVEDIRKNQKLISHIYIDKWFDAEIEHKSVRQFRAKVVVRTIHAN